MPMWRLYVIQLSFVVFNFKYKIDVATANEINKLFCEVVIAPEYDEAQLQFSRKEKPYYLSSNEVALPSKQVRTCLNGF
jgi:phosphoribosylaminoimidazolecarboxamide formyltransferase/IMP cyclohydrolase